LFDAAHEIGGNDRQQAFVIAVTVVRLRDGVGFGGYHVGEYRQIFVFDRGNRRFGGTGLGGNKASPTPAPEGTCSASHQGVGAFDNIGVFSHQSFSARSKNRIS
jgi:hypothetical protein